MTRYLEITPAEANARLDQFHVVDVRADHEFRGPLGHIRRSELVPLPDLTAHAPTLPVDRPVLLVCRSGARSGKACELLMDQGHARVVNLAGGMIAWNRAHLPVDQHDPGSLVDLLELIVSWVAQVSPLTADATREIFRAHMLRSGADLDHPTHAAVDGLLDLVEESLSEQGNLADLDLSLRSFRRSLAVL